MSLTPSVVASPPATEQPPESTLTILSIIVVCRWLLLLTATTSPVKRTGRPGEAGWCAWELGSTMGRYFECFVRSAAVSGAFLLF